MSDPAVRVTVPAEYAEAAGALLYDVLGPFQEIGEGGERHLLFYPFRHGSGYVTDEEISSALPPDIAATAGVERVLVPGGWEDGWKEHFRPITVRRLRVRPPWEPADEADDEAAQDLLDIVLVPGLAFGTGLHPTTRGVLTLLQDRHASGPILDVGCGSGILSIAAARLGYGPVVAIDNDPQAVEAARANVASNGLEVTVWRGAAEDVNPAWFECSTVLANMTLEPVVALLDRLAGKASQRGSGAERVLVAGILSGKQERSLAGHITNAGLRAVTRLYEREWVSMDLRPI